SPWSDPVADVVLVSHGHPDHSATERVQGNPKIVRGPGVHNRAGVTFRGISSFHDNLRGAQRGHNTIYTFTLDNLRFAHLGDLGQASLTPVQLRQIGKIDVLFIPVGGHFTIDAKAATRIMNQIKPRFVVPMHYKTKYTADRLPIVGVNEFLRGKRNIHRARHNTEILSWLEVRRQQPEILVFPPPEP
ncbi:MAG: MBL fold metallo-hydrolase, partial [Armatimonadetes bacterium]|nr:MBL fold metallo-hydrolase [Armatimonadota bacterium]